MNESCAIAFDKCFELVIADCPHAMMIHKELYHFAEHSYFLSDNMIQGLSNILNKIGGMQSPISRLHIVGTWESFIKLLSNKEMKPSVKEALIYLQAIGLHRNELQPFLDSDINDVFTWLFYANKIDALKKLCHNLKKHVGNISTNKMLRIDCHLICVEVRHIVASSL